MSKSDLSSIKQRIPELELSFGYAQTQIIEIDDLRLRTIDLREMCGQLRPAKLTS
jgi:hypothetical protein